MKINRKTNQCFVLSVTSCVFASHALLPRGKQIPICSSVLFLHRAGHRRGAAEHVCVCVCVCICARGTDFWYCHSRLTHLYWLFHSCLSRGESRKRRINSLSNSSPENEKRGKWRHTQRGGNFWATFRFSGRALNSFLEHEFLMLLIWTRTNMFFTWLIHKGFHWVL